MTAKDGVITAITWDGVGCSISQASVSIASDLLVNKSFDQADSILNEFTELMHSKGTKEGNPDVLEDAVALAGVSKFPARIKCALLGWMAFKDAAVRINTTTGGE
jgi:nitrogen fixation NifU-like protein